jgi:CBS domain-containing protein
MNLGSICTRPVITMPRSGNLRQAAGLMREHHVGSLVITEDTADGPWVAGLITDRDLAIDVLARGVDAASVEVGRVLDSRLVSAPEDADLTDAIDLMQAEGVRRLLVRNEDGDLVGLVSFDDLLEVCAAQLSGLAAVARAGIEQEAAKRAAAAAPARPTVRVPAMGTASWLPGT